jgi:hypothetical protein
MPQDFQSPSEPMAHCRITRHFPDQLSTVAAFLVDLVHLVCFVYLIGLV